MNEKELKKQKKEQAKLERKIARYKRKKQMEENKAVKGITGFWQEFINFIKRGNALSMAIGVIVGGAFSAIVTSFNKDVIMPFVGSVMKSEVDVRGLEYHFNDAEPIGKWVDLTLDENLPACEHTDGEEGKQGKIINKDGICDTCQVQYQEFVQDLDEYGNLKYSNMIYYGRLIQYAIDFVITAFILFLVLRVATSISNAIAKTKKKVEDALYAEEPVAPVEEAPAEVVIPEDIKLLTEIRDLLAKQKEE